MKSFALLKLPQLPRDRALQFLSAGDLFELSLCSKKLTEIIRSLRCLAEEHCVTLTMGQHLICVKFNNGKNAIWYDFRNFYMIDMLTEKRNISGVQFNKIGKGHNMFGTEEFYCEHPNLGEGMIAVTKHFSRIFPGPLVLELNPFVLDDISELLSQPYFRRCTALRLYGSKKVGPALLSQIFDNITVEQELMIKTDTDDSYPILQALHVDTLYMDSGLWMRREHLLELNCRTADIRDHKFTCDDFKAFAEKWRISSETRLKSLRFEWDEDKVFQLNGLESNRWNPEKRERVFILEEGAQRERINCAHGYDLEREDGLIGTFVLDPDPLTPSVRFFVWHEPFPEKKRIEQLPTQLAPSYRQLESLNRQYPDASSLERMLANPQLGVIEFLETYDILMNLDAEYRPISIGRSHRRVVFDKMHSLIDIDRSTFDRFQ